ncbi:MAG: hypothetical protein ACRCS8_01875 [Brevinema sp.]
MSLKEKLIYFHSHPAKATLEYDLSNSKGLKRKLIKLHDLFEEKKKLSSNI